MSDLSIVVAAVFGTAAAFFFGAAAWICIKDGRTVRAFREALDGLAVDADRRYLDWLEGQLAGLPDNDVEHEGEAPR